MGQITDQTVNNPSMNPTRHTVKALLTNTTLEACMLTTAKKGAAIIIINIQMKIMY